MVNSEAEQHSPCRYSCTLVPFSLASSSLDSSRITEESSRLIRASWNGPSGAEGIDFQIEDRLIRKKQGVVGEREVQAGRGIVCPACTKRPS